MSDFSEFLKKVEREINVGVRKSGLRDLYNKNKSLILTAGLNAPFAALGLVKDRKRSMENKATDEQARIAGEQQQQEDAVYDFLDEIRGPDGGGPVMGDDPTPIQHPTYEEGDITGGLYGSGGQAGDDIQRLLDEALFQKGEQEKFAGGQKDTRAQMLQEYADLISQQQSRLFDEKRPDIYEDLNTRGLLRSSELGNAFGREQQRAAQILAEQVGLQGLQDRGAHLGDMAGIQNQYHQGRYGALQRGMSLEDFARQTEAAMKTGLALQPIPQATPSAKGGSALQGGIGGATVGGSVGGVPGAVIGGLGGMLGGGQLGSK